MMREMEKLLKDYRLTTAEILYHMPDHPAILQTYVWQDYDIAPRFPVLRGFLTFWERSLEGRLHSVTIASCGLVQDARLHHAGLQLTLH